MSEQSRKSRNLEITGASAVLLWWLPVAALIVGANWQKLTLLLWIPALLVMGAACLASTARCGRVHCYVTGPLFLLAAVYVALRGLPSRADAARHLPVYHSGHNRARLSRGNPSRQV